MSKGHGMFVWYDVMTTDTKAAQSFYHEVIGWDAKPIPACPTAPTRSSRWGRRWSAG